MQGFLAGVSQPSPPNGFAAIERNDDENVSLRYNNVTQTQVVNSVSVSGIPGNFAVFGANYADLGFLGYSSQRAAFYSIGTAISDLALLDTRVTALVQGVQLGLQGGLDDDVAAFRTATGAQDVVGLNRLVVYLKEQSLWDYARFYPMKSSQNAGSGSTVYGLGGLTTNNMTLVNSPTWGSDGVTFNGSTQYGDCGRLFNGGNITAFASLRYLSAVETTAVWFGQYSGTLNQRSFAAAVAGAEAALPIRLYRFPNGTSSPLEVYDALSASYPTSSQQVLTVSWAGSDVGLWIEKESQTLTLSLGTPQSSFYNANQSVFFAGSNDNGSLGLPSNIESSAFLFLTGTGVAPTTTQRETITDLINAL